VLSALSLFGSWTVGSLTVGSHGGRSVRPQRRAVYVLLSCCSSGDTYVYRNMTLQWRYGQPSSEGRTEAIWFTSNGAERQGEPRTSTAKLQRSVR